MRESPRTLGVVLIGYDGAGIQNHQYDMYEPAFIAHPDFEVVAVSDAEVSEDRRSLSMAAASRLGVPYFEDIDAALAMEGIDVASVAVAFDQRVATIASTTAHGIHSLVDKPLALTLDDVAAIDAMTTEKGLICMPAHHHRFKETMRSAAAALQGDQIGSLRSIHADFIVTSGATRAAADRPTAWPLGELMNFLVYPVDSIRTITGREVQRVHATRGGFFYGGEDDEDFGVLSLTLDDGTIATVSVGRAPVVGHLDGLTHRYRLIGSDGWLLVDATDPFALVNGGGRSRRVPAITAPNSVDLLLGSLADAIRSGTPPGLSADDARAALAVTLAARKSADTGHVITLG